MPDSRPVPATEGRQAGQDKVGAEVGRTATEDSASAAPASRTRVRVSPRVSVASAVVPTGSKVGAAGERDVSGEGDGDAGHHQDRLRHGASRCTTVSATGM